mgnify:CR=1 FL=1
MLNFRLYKRDDVEVELELPQAVSVAAVKVFFKHCVFVEEGSVGW